MPTRHTANFKQGRGGQRGAVLMVMLVLLVVSVAAILVNSLTTTSLKNARQAQTAAALAQAKAALIDRAVADLTSPGSLPCPDALTNIPGNIPGDGIADLFSGNQCPSYIGKLPWKTLGLPDLLDGSGEELWYALSPNFRDFASVAPINSDTQGTLNVTGTAPANNVIAIVFSAGSPLSGQNRSSTPVACVTTGTSISANLCGTNYLEGSNASLSTAASLNSAYQTAASSSAFNDQMIYITHDALFPPVERRIAREAKACLDNYAAVSTNKYPWAAPTADSSSSPGINGNYNGTYGKYFGRLPVQPNIDTSPPNPGSASQLMTALNTLQAAESAYQSINSSANQTALYNAANTVIGMKSWVSSVSSTTIDHAGDYGNYYANGSVSYTTAAGYVTTAVNAVNSSGNLDLSMSISWPASCTLLNNPGSYFWAAWKNMVFFQVASGYQPGGSGPPTPGTLTINGSGAYRATVLIARVAISSAQLAARGTPSTSPPTPYLEGLNPHSNSALTTTFETYRPTDSNYTTVNDLVLCLDGGNQCP